MSISNFPIATFLCLLTSDISTKYFRLVPLIIIKYTIWSYNENNCAFYFVLAKYNSINFDVRNCLVTKKREKRKHHYIRTLWREKSVEANSQLLAAWTVYLPHPHGQSLLIFRKRNGIETEGGNSWELNTIKEVKRYNGLSSHSDVKCAFNGSGFGTQLLRWAGPWDPAIVHTHNMPKAPLASLVQQTVHAGAFYSKTEHSLC